jgi:hypothetical protein
VFGSIDDTSGKAMLRPSSTMMGPRKTSATKTKSGATKAKALILFARSDARSLAFRPSSAE